jgi:hypothetical protein
VKVANRMGVSITKNVDNREKRSSKTTTEQFSIMLMTYICHYMLIFHLTYHFGYADIATFTGNEPHWPSGRA